MSQINSFANLKHLNIISYFQFAFILGLLALAGTPPFIGFITKLLAILLLFKKNQYLILFIFLFINMFSIYFYIAVTRFITNQQINDNSYNKFYYYKVSYQSIINTIYLLLIIVCNIFLYNEFLNLSLMLFTYM